MIGKSAALAAAFRAQGLPVVLVNVTGVAPGRTAAPRYDGPFPDIFADLVPELDQQPTDHTVTKQTCGAFTGTNLDAWLKSVGATQVVLTGVATSIGVESTARQAHELGFNVAMAFAFLPPDKGETQPRRLDLTGLALLSPGLVLAGRPHRGQGHVPVVLRGQGDQGGHRPGQAAQADQ